MCCVYSHVCSSHVHYVYIFISHIHLISLLRPELDACDSPEKYPQLFHVILDVEVEGVDKQKDLTPPWEQFPCKDLNPNVLFSCHQEHQDALAIAGTVGGSTLGPIMSMHV